MELRIVVTCLDICVAVAGVDMPGYLTCLDICVAVAGVDMHGYLTCLDICVAVAGVQSGLRTRTLTTTADGTIIAVDYNSKSTCTVNARVRVHRLDGTCVIASEDGHVHYRSGDVHAGDDVLGAGVGYPTAEAVDGVPAPSGRSTPLGVDRDPNIGVFQFDLWKGHFQVRSREKGNQSEGVQKAHGGRGVLPLLFARFFGCRETLLCVCPVVCALSSSSTTRAMCTAWTRAVPPV